MKDALDLVVLERGSQQRPPWVCHSYLDPQIAEATSRRATIISAAFTTNSRIITASMAKSLLPRGDVDAFDCMHQVLQTRLYEI